VNVAEVLVKVSASVPVLVNVSVPVPVKVSVPVAVNLPSVNDEAQYHELTLAHPLDPAKENAPSESLPELHHAQSASAYNQERKSPRTSYASPWVCVLPIQIVQ
jgi:hypothetical protein